MRNGVFDEYGIGFYNSAVVAVSSPIFTFECAHRNKAHMNAHEYVIKLMSNIKRSLLLNISDVKL